MAEEVSAAHPSRVAVPPSLSSTFDTCVEVTSKETGARPNVHVLSASDVSSRFVQVMLCSGNGITDRTAVGSWTVFTTFEC